MNIGLLSNSLINRTLSFQSSYVFDADIDTILLPFENHSQKEEFFSGRERIQICDSVDNIVANSDIIVTSNPGFLKSPKTILIKNPWIDEGNNNKHNRFPVTNKPVIAILSFGLFTDIYYIEVTINKVLTENGAKVHHFFSHSTINILSDLASQIHINNNLTIQESEKVDTYVISIDCTKYFNDSDFIFELYKISPSIIFVCLDGTITNFDSIKSLCGLFGDISLVISSPYIPYDVGTGIHYPVYFKSSYTCADLNSFDITLENKIKKCLMDRLYYPHGIRFI